MLEFRRVALLPAVTRLVLLALLLAGIVTMHVVTFALGHDARASVSATVQHHTMGVHAAPDTAPCDTDDCGQQHTGMHGCVFVMTAVAIVAGLATLCWMATRRARLFAPKTRRGFRRRQRAPPWTVLSLHQLSILRV